MSKKYGEYLTLYSIGFFASFVFSVVFFAYLVNFDYFFWNAGAIPFSAWIEITIKNLWMELLLASALAASYTYYFVVK